MKHHHSRQSRISAISAAALMAAGVGLIATTPATAYETDEIVVTAQKRAQPLQDVPVAVTAVGGEYLEAAGINNLEDLQNIAPTVVINSSTGGSESIFTIRGIGTAGQNAGLEQSVGVYIDGVYRGRPGPALGDYVNIQQIEILRGPQNTLFGKNTSAGVISVRTAPAEFEFGGRVEGQYEVEQSGYTLKGSVTGPVSEDKLAARLSATVRKHDGFIDDVGTGDDLNDRDRHTIRAQFDANLGENTTARLIGDYTESKDKCCAAPAVIYGPTSAIIAGIGGTLVGVAGPGPANPFNRKVATQSSYYDDRFKDKGVSLQLDHDMEDYTLTVIGSYRMFENPNSIDADFTDLDILDDRQRIQEIDEQSVEVRLASNGEGNLDWIVGAYWFNQDIDQRETLGVGAHGRPYLGTLATLLSGGTPLGTIETDLDAYFGGAPATPFLFVDAITSMASYDYQAESYALFGQATWYLENDWSVTAGLRYSDEEKTSRATYAANDYLSTVDLTVSNPMNPDGTPNPTYDAGAPAYFHTLIPLQLLVPHDPYTANYSDTNWSWTFAVGKEIDEDTSAYARVARGYKAGGINLSTSAGGQAAGITTTATPSNAIFQPEQVTSYELGLKKSLHDGALKVNIAAFWQELEDYQANSFDGLRFTVRNAATVISRGLETEYTYVPTENWFLNGGIVWSDIEYDSYPNGSAITGMGSVQNLTGRRPNFVSDWNITGAVAYMSDPLENGWVLSPRLDYQYRSDYHTGQDLDPNTLQDSYWLVGASLTAIAENGIEVAIWGKNLTDEKIFNIVFDTPAQAGSYNAFVRDPQTWGFTVRAPL
ncbi:MAG: TonB-dependent receptor [Alphaproteobacteria bacterium]